MSLIPFYDMSLLETLTQLIAEERQNDLAAFGLSLRQSLRQVQRLLSF